MYNQKTKKALTKDNLTAFIEEIILEELEEAQYPPSFNPEEFKNLNSFKARLSYVKSRMPKLGQGSSRAVFEIDNETVLKVALNEKGLAQNSSERDIGKFSDLYPVAKVFDSSPDDFWVEMQKARKAKKSDFKKILGITFLDFYEIMNYVKFDGYRQFDPPNSYKEMVQSGENEFFNQLIDLIANYDMAIRDIKAIGSWGVVSENGKERLILVDFGATTDIINRYY